MTIKALFWDVGGVLLTNGWDREQRAKVVSKFGIDLNEFSERHKLAVSELELGRMTLDEYLNQTVFYTPRSFIPEVFRAAMHEQSQPQPETLALARDLAQRWRMYSLNNEGKDLNDYRIKTFGLAEFLLAFFSSCTLEMLKPSPAIYRLGLALVNLPAQNVVMIDDRLQNVEVARSIGMQAIQYVNAAQLKEELAALGVV